MNKIAKNLRASARVALGLPFMLGAMFVLSPLQSFVVGPLLKNQTAIPGFIYNNMRRLLGITVEFNAASAPLEQKKQAWFVANHQATADFVVTGSVLKGLFVAAGNLQKNPIVNILSQAAKIIFVTQKKAEEFKRQDRGRIIGAFNKGQNIVMFPEGAVNDGDQVKLFRAGLTSILYGAEANDLDGNPVTLEKEVVVQPIAIKVKSVGGKDATNDPVLRDAYTMNGKHNMLSRIWDRLGQKDITIELQAFPAMDPKDYGNAMDLMNEAHRQIVSVVSPDQGETIAAKIGEPGGGGTPQPN